MATLADKLSGAVRWGDNPAFVGDSGDGGNGGLSASMSVQSVKLVMVGRFFRCRAQFLPPTSASSLSKATSKATAAATTNNDLVAKGFFFAGLARLLWCWPQRLETRKQLHGL